jgi:dihydroneopterin aldolase/2-amino-4-hydroxy-6-hydroxymethyldihydropteridine diphosphokinase
MTICFLGIGSNLGNRHKNIKAALKKINLLKDTQILKSSRIIESQPVGGPLGQDKFLNAVLKIRTALPAFSLLKKLKNIEKELGRIKSARFGPRAIDLDILLYGDQVIKNKKLEVPHPRMFARDFVIGPLLEII